MCDSTKGRVLQQDESVGISSKRQRVEVDTGSKSRVDVEDEEHAAGLMLLAEMDAWLGDGDTVQPEERKACARCKQLRERKEFSNEAWSHATPHCNHCNKPSKKADISDGSERL